MWLKELTAIGMGLLVLANGSIVWMIYRAICYPHPTVQSAEMLHRLRSTVARLKSEVARLEAQKRSLETTVYTLSRQVQQLQQRPLPERQP